MTHVFPRMHSRRLQSRPLLEFVIEVLLAIGWPERCACVRVMWVRNHHRSRLIVPIRLATTHQILALGWSPHDALDLIGKVVSAAHVWELSSLGHVLVVGVSARDPACRCCYVVWAPQPTAALNRFDRRTKRARQ